MALRTAYDTVHHSFIKYDEAKSGVDYTLHSTNSNKERIHEEAE